MSRAAKSIASTNVQLTSPLADNSASRRPPGPKWLPLLGNLLELRRDILGHYEQWARQYGDIVALRFGAWPAVLLNNSDHAEYVLVRNHRNFIKFPLFFRHVQAIFGHGLLTSEGEFWLRQRRLAAPAFHAERVAGYGAVMVGETERMLAHWRDGELRDAHADMMAVTLRIAAKTLFNAEVEEDISDIGTTSETLANEIMHRVRRPFRIPDLVPTPGNIRYRRGVRRIDGLVSRIIAERQRDGRDRGDLLSMLMLARDDEGRPMSDQQLRDEVVTLLLAGHETTAVALSWTWYLLSQHPQVEAKLAAELKRVLGGRPPTAYDLPGLIYAEQVVTEAMRLYPPVFGIGRAAIAD